MSVVVCGEDERVDLLSKYLVHYAALCNGSQLPTSNQGVTDMTITNKYYSASVRLHSLNLGEELSAEVEGFIVVPAANQADLTSQLYAACHSAVDADVGLRLLVAISDEREQHSAEATRHYEEWAIDNGFEYIEIVAPHVTKGHEDREKFGLPRLMEALESNMWSTMQRRTASTASNAATASSSSSSAAATAARGSAAAESAGSSSCAGDEMASVAAVATVATVGDSAPSTSAGQNAAPAEVSEPESQASEPAHGAAVDTPTAVEAEEGLGSLTLEEAFAEAEDNELLDQYAGFISEVKGLRELSVKGELSDSARRDQAAAMATKLMQMFALDDESDSEADS